MSLDRIINMVVNRVLRILVNKGVSAGINAIGKGASKSAKSQPPLDEDRRA